MQTIPDFITIEELPNYQNQPHVILLDVRDAQSFAQRHLPEAMSLQPEQLVEQIYHLDEEKHYIVVCYHGIMAVSIMEFMRERDFDASVLQGGMSVVP